MREKELTSAVDQRNLRPSDAASRHRSSQRYSGEVSRSLAYTPILPDSRREALVLQYGFAAHYGVTAP